MAQLVFPEPAKSDSSLAVQSHSHTEESEEDEDLMNHIGQDSSTTVEPHELEF